MEQVNVNARLGSHWNEVSHFSVDQALGVWTPDEASVSTTYSKIVTFYTLELRVDTIFATSVYKIRMYRLISVLEMKF